MTETKAKRPPVPPPAAAADPVALSDLRALVARIEQAQGSKGRQAHLLAQLVVDGAAYHQDARLGRTSLRLMGLEAFSYVGNAALLTNLAAAARRAIARAEAG
jgi:hypothetical protein